MKRACEACHSPIPNPLDAFERRLEFRRPYDQKRVKTVKTRLVCRACMDDEVDRIKRPHVMQQGTLLVGER